jgi:hypothetical protein
MMTSSSPRRFVQAFCYLSFMFAVAVFLLVVAGCSTAPIADTMDFLFPGRFPANAKGVVGGVCVPQGGPAGGMLGAPGVAPPTAPGVLPAPADGPPPAPIGQTPTPGLPK